MDGYNYYLFFQKRKGEEGWPHSYLSRHDHENFPFHRDITATCSVPFHSKMNTSSQSHPGTRNKVCIQKYPSTPYTLYPGFRIKSRIYSSQSPYHVSNLKYESTGTKHLDYYLNSNYLSFLLWECHFCANIYHENKSTSGTDNVAEIKGKKKKRISTKDGVVVVDH